MSPEAKRAAEELHADGNPAPCDNDPIITINIAERTCRARRYEYARRKSANGKVTFIANHSHPLFFSEEEVFGMRHVDLIAGEERTLSVQVDSPKETKYALEPQFGGNPGNPKIVIP